VRQTVGLAMLVRDEADVLPHTLPPILDIVDAVTVVDTGSTDDTPDIVRDLTGQDPIRRPWKDFAHNRSELLRLASVAADWTLMLDADHRLHVHGDRPELTADSYMIRIRGRMEWRLPLLTRAAHPFRYKGAAHAYLTSDQPASKANLEWLSIEGGPGASKAKLERDRLALETAHAGDPGDARTVHYLAQTYRDLDMPAEAIRYYRMRANMGGWAEEAYWARYMLGCLLATHVSFAQGADELLAAWKQRPQRVEALRALANAANAVAAKTPVPDDVLFVHPHAYRQEAAA
jgi:glycosyltransferase involved in cell wall biosynthesis